jgi:hypothetical protein
VLWRERDDVIFSLSPPSDDAPQSLAHLIHPDQLVRRAPVNGLDVEPLRPTSRPRKTPRCRVLGSNDGTSMKPPSQPIRFSRYRSVTRPAGMPRPTGGRRGCGATDLGLLLVEPLCTGLCQITLTYDGGAEARWTVVAQWMGSFA